MNGTIRESTGLSGGFMLAAVLAINLANAADPGGVPVERSIGSAYSIGRVFMTPAERNYLDKLRLATPATDGVAALSAENAEPQAVTPVKMQPAGYIVSSTGVPYQWLDGDFRATSIERIKSLQRADAVTIIRHRRQSESVTPQAGAAIDSDGADSNDDLDTDGDEDAY